MDDEVIFSEQGVVIDRSLARFGGVSYSVSNINSVVVHRANSKGALLWLIAGLLFIFAVGSVVGGNPALAVVLFLAAGFAGYKAYTNPWNQVLMLRTSGGEQQAYVTRDPALAERIKAALEQAISTR